MGYSLASASQIKTANRTLIAERTGERHCDRRDECLVGQVVDQELAILSREGVQEARPLLQNRA